VKTTRTLIRKLVWPQVVILLLGVANLSLPTILCFKEDGRVQVELSANGYRCQPCRDATSSELVTCDACTDMPLISPGIVSTSSLQRELSGKMIPGDAIPESLAGSIAPSEADSSPQPEHTWLSPPAISIRSVILLI